jgi:hypothetical protein
MNKLQQIMQLYQNMGGKYFAFRAWYEFRRKSGLLKSEFPINPEQKKYITLAQWREEAAPFFFRSRDALNIKKVKDDCLKEDARRILSGEIQFFSHEWNNLGKDYDWLTNPDSGYHYNINKHWTEVADLSKEAGDIKFIWEKSRFSYLYTIIRYDYHFDEDHSEYVFREIVDWIEKNPINQGPNYKCSQEISLRILNWTFALYFYRNSESLTEDVFQKIMHSIYWQIRHVRSNIHFSRISVRNNHAITETLTLYLTSLLYPFFPEAEERKRRGKAWFEEEIAYQVYEDGTFLQFSMNYHRVVIQLLTWAIGLAELNKEKYADVVYERAYKSVDYLYQCQEESNGWLPNYGSNDGALFFKLSQNDYRDYRPQLDALHQMLTGKKLYAEDFEDKSWYAVSLQSFPPIKKKYGCIYYPVSGYYLIREQDTLTFIHCGGYKDRPAQADNMHIDIWYKGENVLLDAGSYKYNTTPELTKYFIGTSSHNTVMLGDNDQMLKGGRFIWFFWPKDAKGYLKEEADEFVFEGKINTFRQLGDEITQIRKIIKKKNIAQWCIYDEIKGKPNELKLRQLWHTKSETVRIDNRNCKRKESRSWVSDYYGVKSECRQIELASDDNKIETKITIE